MIADPKKLDEKLKRLDESDFEEGTSLLEDSVRKFKKNKMAVFGCFMITFLFLLSLFAKLVTPYSYDEGKLENQNFPPTWYKPFLSKELRAAPHLSLDFQQDFLSRYSFNPCTLKSDTHID